LKVIQATTTTRTQEAVPDRCRPSSGPTGGFKTVDNVCGLACIFGLTHPHNQVSLTTKPWKHSAQGMVLPHCSRKGTRVPLQTVHITIVERDALLAMRLCTEPLTTP